MKKITTILIWGLLIGALGTGLTTQETKAATPVLTNPSVSSNPVNINQPVWFNVTYSDADNDMPSPRQVWIDSGSGFLDWTLVDSAPGGPYTGGVNLWHDHSGFTSPGTVYYYFLVGDGTTNVRLPTSGSYSLTVESDPVLTNPSVSSNPVNINQPVWFNVTYSDADNDMPSPRQVWIDSGGGFLDWTLVDSVPGGPYTGGVNLWHDHSGFTSPGTVYYYFLVGDGTKSVRLPTSGSYSLTVNTVDSVAPTIDSFTPSSTSGGSSAGVTVSVSDTGGSGLYRYCYAWSDSTTKPADGPSWSSWDTSITGSSDTFQVLKNDQGTWYLHVEVEDNELNRGYGYGGPYTINYPPVAVTLSSPTGVTRDSVDLDWSQSVDADFQKYEVHYSTTNGFIPGSGTLYETINTKTTTSTTVSSLSSSTLYYFKIVVYDTVSQSNSSNQVSATTSAPPNPPPVAVNLNTPTGVTHNSVDLGWSQSVDADFQKYEVHYSTADGFTPGLGTLYETINTKTTISTTVSSLLSSTLYYFKVMVYDTISQSNSSNQVSATTSAPPNPPPVAVNLNTPTSVTSNSVDLDWSQSVDADFQKYEVHYSTTNGFTPGLGTLYETINIKTSISTTVTGLTASTAYYFKIAVYDTASQYNSSNQVNATTDAPPNPPPVAVTLNAPSGVTHNSADLSWSQSIDTDFQKYEVHYSTTNGFTPGPGTLYSTINTKTINLTTVTGLAASTLYYFKIVVYDTTNQGNSSNQVSATTSALPNPPPVAVSLNTPTGVTHNSVDLSWSQSVDADFQRYEVHYSTTNGFAPGPGTLYETINTKTTTSTTASSLSSSTLYYFKIVVYDTVSQSNSSNQVSATTSAPPNPPPVAVNLNTPTGVTYNSVDLGWSQSVDTDFQKYEVHYSTTDGFTPGLGTLYETINTKTTISTTVSSLLSSTLYYFKVMVYDTISQSNSSNQVSTTTGEAPNSPPSLTSGQVSPSSGDSSTIFTYSVTYTDSDNDAPSIRYVYIDGASHVMYSADSTYNDGSIFTYTTTLADGNHYYYFDFNDGQGHSEILPMSGTTSGPSVMTIPPPTLQINYFHSTPNPEDAMYRLLDGNSPTGSGSSQSFSSDTIFSFLTTKFTSGATLNTGTYRIHLYLDRDARLSNGQDIGDVEVQFCSYANGHYSSQSTSIKIGDIDHTGWYDLNIVLANSLTISPGDGLMVKIIFFIDSSWARFYWDGDNLARSYIDMEPTNIGYSENFAINADKLKIALGNTVTFSGRLTDEFGNGIPNRWIGIQDPVVGYSTAFAALTDGEGYFDYPVYISNAGHYWFEFYGGSETKRFLIEVTLGQPFNTYQSLKFENTQDRVIKVQVWDIGSLSPFQAILGNNNPRTYRVPIGGTLYIIDFVGIPPMSVTAGTCYGAPGSSICIETDGTLTGEVGESIVVGLYANDQTNTFGISGGVGYELGAIKGSGVITAGTDGVGLEVSAAAGVMGKLRVDILSWEEVDPTYCYVEAHCPLDLLVVDENNNRVGYDYSNGSTVNDIRGAIYSGPNSTPETIFIPNVSGRLYLKICGNGAGNYNILIRRSIDGVISEYWFNGTITENAVIEKTIEEPIISPSSSLNNKYLISIAVGSIMVTVVVGVIILRRWKRRHLD